VAHRTHKKAIATWLSTPRDSNVHELREFHWEQFGAAPDESGVLIYRYQLRIPHGVPTYLRPRLRCPLPAQSELYSGVQQANRQESGRVAEYIRSFPQNKEFMTKISTSLPFFCLITLTKERAT